MTCPSTRQGAEAGQQWIENDFDRLDRFARIYLATDMDGPGNEAAEETQTAWDAIAACG